MDPDKLKLYLEAALLAAGQPLTLAQMNALFEEDEQPGHSLIRQALAALDAELEGRAVELIEVASGYRLQVRQKLMPVISKMWTEKPPRYSRALLETLAIIAYRQPITRGEIEQIRGVSLSANILKTLQDREWIKIVGHRDVPGKPELLGTTKTFLDYFNLKGLDDLPTLAEIRDLDNLEPELELSDPDRPARESSTDEQHAEATDTQDHDPTHEDGGEDDGAEEARTDGPDGADDGEHGQSAADEEAPGEDDELEDGFDEDGLDDAPEEDDDEEDDGPEPGTPDFDDEDDDEPDPDEAEDDEADLDEDDVDGNRRDD